MIIENVCPKLHNFIKCLAQTDFFHNTCDVTLNNTICNFQYFLIIEFIKEIVLTFG